MRSYLEKSYITSEINAGKKAGAIGWCLTHRGVVNPKKPGQQDLSLASVSDIRAKLRIIAWYRNNMGLHLLGILLRFQQGP